MTVYHLIDLKTNFVNQQLNIERSDNVENNTRYVDPSSKKYHRRNQY